MLRHGLALVALLALMGLVAGCGGEGTAPAPTGTVRYEAGPVQIEGSSGLQMVQISSGNYAPVLFTGYYGAQITKLTQVGFNRLAFSSVRAGTAGFDVCTIADDGTGFARLTTWAHSELSPDYSPNGAKIAFDVNVAGNNEIYSMDADGTDIVRLTSMPNYDGQASWSPDGTKIVFTSGRSGDADIWVMNADGTGQTALYTAPGSNQQQPAWSPDGRRIAFVTGAPGNDDICAMNADGSYPMMLTTDAGVDSAPAWSPDGKLIAFTSTRVGGIPHVYTMNADGSDQTARSSGASGDAVPCFSPDGTRLAYQRGADIVVQPVGATEPRNITLMNGVSATPVWVPSAGVVRSLIGGVHSDGGSEPPFGTARPLVILGLTSDGLVEAATVDVLTTMWSNVSMQGLANTGIVLTGVVIEAPQIDAVREDRGRGIAPRVWSTPSPTGTRLATVIFNAQTGRISTVLASSTATITAAARAATRTEEGSLVLEGPFDAAWGEDPDRNLAPVGAARVVLDAETGRILEIQQ